VTAASDLQRAQASVVTAKDELAALNARIADGDTSVTGAYLTACESAVTVADRIQTGAETRATAETAAAQAAAAEAAIETMKAGYTASAAKLSDAVATAIAGIESLIATALDFRASAGANLSAAMSFGPDAVGISRYQRLQGGALAGFGSVLPPSTSAIVRGLRAVTQNIAAGRANTRPSTGFTGHVNVSTGDPNLAAIAPFLPSEPEKVPVN
jgi:hypothetical protein